MKDFLTKWIPFLTPKDKEMFFGVLGLGNEDKSYEFDEVVGVSATPLFMAKLESDWRTFFQQYQYTCSACVAFTLAKLESVLYFLKTGRKVKFSPGFWYIQRANRPAEGMFFDDIQKLGTQGALIADLLPSEGLTEDQMNNLKIEQYQRDCADAFALPDTWVNLPLDFDTVAATIERTGKAVMIWVKIRSGEYLRNRIPVLNPSSVAISGHSICAVDAFTFNGVQYILCEDSAEINTPLRLITREFYQARCYLSRYPVNFKFEVGDKPMFDGTIISAQKCLRFEGFFPSNIVYTEVVGKITTAALRGFQQKHGLSIDGTLSSETVALLQKLYA